MPCDINNPDTLSEYDSTFSKISALCIKNDVQNLCVLYDMNTDLSRFHSWHTQSLLTFIENEDLFITLNHSCAYISYSYCNTYTSAFSIIEHIFVSQRLSSYIHKYHSINDKFDNQSDHVLIVIAFHLELETSKVTSNLHRVRTLWKKQILFILVNINQISMIVYQGLCYRMIVYIALMFCALIINTLRVLNYYMIS